ncbi:CRTAC1 family protein [Falsihalocynthiibacter sp. BN13B15]|uniref:CRTAC1 family protein n=1 Tax=Falsihalocynthiibacter sp. BN13B15 TaxID=3240871 RepID=UPI00350F5110
MQFGKFRKMHKAKILVVVATSLSTSAFAAPEFTRLPAPPHQYVGGWEHYVGGGLAAFDCNDDALPELYAAGGEAPAALLLNTTAQMGDTPSFSDNTPESLALTGVTGAYPIDIDSDGHIDLAILRVGENRFLRGLGDCAFTPFTSLDYIPDTAWTTAFSATWEGTNALPTMAFGNYVDRDDPEGPFGTCDENTLLRPKDGTYSTPTQLAPGFCALSILFSDWSRSGQADLRVSNDRHYYVKGGSEQMWKMASEPRLYTQADGWKDYMIWGMGIASRDLTGDGYSEVYLTSMGDQKLQSPTGDGTPNFIDYTYERGTTAHRPFTGEDGRPSTGWHVAFGDIENNGRDDIFIAKGNVERMAGAAMEDPNNLLIQDENGNFSEQGDVAGIASLVRSRGAALVDFNGDGLLDLAVNNRKADIELYQNTSTNTGNWVSLKIQQAGVNRDAIGAFVEVKTDASVQTREITIGGGHAGGELGPLHFGLGMAEAATVRVIWPDHTTSEWYDFTPNQPFVFQRDEGLKPL